MDDTGGGFDVMRPARANKNFGHWLSIMALHGQEQIKRKIEKKKKNGYKGNSKWSLNVI